MVKERRSRNPQGTTKQFHSSKRASEDNAGGRWRSGPHKTADSKRAVRRIDSLDSDDLGESPDY